MFRKIFCLLVSAALSCTCAQALTRSEIRALWQALTAESTQASPYLIQPDPERFLSGALTEAACAQALDCLNFLRTLAGLESVSLSELYGLRAQNGAMLLAAGDVLDHHPAQPDGMEDALYASALAGTAQGNIAKFNWMQPQILIDGIIYFARDDGDANLADLGHRRWLLNPCMAETGFGLANSASGMSYVTMYAVDMGNDAAQWSQVAWPAAGAFPVELMRRDLPWSISLNDEIYDLAASSLTITLREARSGASFLFDFAQAGGDGYCAISQERYGSGPCLIFRPDLESAGIEEYVQNQLWTVEVTGLQRRDGTRETLRYSCEMVSLYAQDVVNVEMSCTQAALAPGEQLQLSALVVPEYADNPFLRWDSSDSSVAQVDEKGLVTAIAPGACEITAASENGRWDSCHVSVQ